MASGDPLLVERETLEDGLGLTVQSPPAGSPSVAFTYVGPSGLAYDPTDREGLALLAAEIAVLAAGRLDRRALARRIDALGAILSSDASPECTEYTIWGPKDRWRELLGLLGDVVRRPRFDAADLEIARTQLLERQLREETQPDSRADRAFLQTLYPPEHPYYRTGLGTPESIGRIRRRDLAEFQRRHAVARSSHLVATAALARAELRRVVRSAFADGEDGPPPERPDLEAGSGPSRNEVRVAMPGRSQVELRIGARGVARSHPHYPALLLADEVLGGRGMLSRLFQHIRERRGLAYHSSSDLESMAWGGFWVARAGTGSERAEAVERLLREEFRAIRERPIGAGELDRIRESFIGSIQLTLERTSGVHDLAIETAYFGLPPDYFRTLPEELRRLRPAEIREAVASSIDPGSTVLVVAGPGSGASRSA